MSRYLIHKIKENPGELFRWAAHAGGLAIVKPKDYEPADIVEAATPYAAWKQLSEQGMPLRPGDILEALEPDEAIGKLLIVKYIGFEPAEWFSHELKPSADEIVIESASTNT